MEKNINIDDYSDTNDKVEQADYVSPNVSADNVPQDHICPNLETLTILAVDISPPRDQYDSTHNQAYPRPDDLKNVNHFYDRQECLVALPFSAFNTTYPNILSHLDGGANAFIFTKREYFWAYTPTVIPVRQVGGSTINSSGIGIVIIRLNNQVIIPIYPCYHIANNPQNTFSPTALKDIIIIKVLVLRH